MNDHRRGRLADLVKAYDIRGTVPGQLDEDLARLFGAAFAVVTGAEAVVIGHDMRPTSPGLARAFARGATGQGADVTTIGLCSTDQLYFASGLLRRPGAMVTASHNPGQYNGIKLCAAEAAPFGQDSGLGDLRALVDRWLAGAPLPAAGRGAPGRVVQRDLLDAYATHLLGLVDLTSMRPLRVVVDAGNGMAGLTAPVVLRGLPVELVPMYFALDGTFPNHEANPLDPRNIADLQEKVRGTRADIGLAFDGDADRCFVVDERGVPVAPSAITALIAASMLTRRPGATVVHNLITSRTVADVVRENGGIPVRTRVGHSFVKAEMARTKAVFGGEHSAHYYFHDFWNADTGMLAALHVLAVLGKRREPLSQLLAPYDRLRASGEINTAVRDPAAATAAVEQAFTGRPHTETDRLDGLTVSTPQWWFNVRPSNTEPLLRLNVEAAEAQTVDRLKEEVLAIISRC